RRSQSGSRCFARRLDRLARARRSVQRASDRHAEVNSRRSAFCSGYKEPPFRQVAQRTDRNLWSWFSSVRSFSFQRLTCLTLSDLLLPLPRRLPRSTARRRLLDQLQPQLTRLPLQRLELLLLHLRLVLLLTLPHVGQSVLQRQIHDPRQLMRRRRQRRRCAQPPFHPTQKGPQRSLAAVQTMGRQTKRRRRTVHPGTRPTRLDAASRLFPVGTQPQPATELLHRRELRHLRADLADYRQRCQLTDPLDLRQVQPHHVVQRCPDVETGRVDPAFRACLRLQWRQGPVTLHPPQLQRDLPAHLLDLPQGALPGLVGQLQLKQVLLSVRPGQGLGDLRLAGLTLLVAILG